MANSNGTHSAVVSPSATTDYTITCTNPGGTVSKTANVLMPSGTFTATSCVIPFNASSCNSTLNWTANNFLGTPALKQGSTVISNAVSGTMVRAVNPDDHNFSLQDTGSAFRIDRDPLAQCMTGSVWAGGKCIPLPIITIDADSVVQHGDSADMDISIKADYDATCTINDGTIQTLSHSASPTTVDYSVTTRNLDSTQIVVVTCEHDTYPVVVDSEEVRIEVIPTYQEI